MATRKYTHVAISNAVADYTFKISDLQLSAFSLNKGDFQTLSSETRQALELACGTPTLSCGGSICNTLYGMGLLGNTKGCSLASIGDDADGDLYRAEFARVGVDYLPALANTATMAVNVLITPDAQRTFVTRRHSLLHQLSNEAKNRIKNADWLLLEGYVLFNQADLVQQAVTYAKSVGTKVALFVSSKSVPKAFGHVMFDIIRSGIDLLVCNEGEMQALMHATRGHSQARELSGAIHFTPRIITHGAGGATYMDEAEYAFEPIPGKVNVVDTNGCGDAFAAGFLDGYFRGIDIHDALRQGHELASKVAQQFGARLPQL